jgi:hypothetical protein
MTDLLCPIGDPRTLIPWTVGFWKDDPDWSTRPSVIDGSVTMGDWSSFGSQTPTAVQNTETAQPEYTAFGATSDTVDDYLEVSDLGGEINSQDGPQTFVWIAEHLSGVLFDGLGTTTETWNGRARVRVSGGAYSWYGGAGGAYDVTSVTPDGDRHIHRVVMDYSSDPRCRWWIDEVEQTVDPATGGPACGYIQSLMLLADYAASSKAGVKALEWWSVYNGDDLTTAYADEWNIFLRQAGFA